MRKCDYFFLAIIPYNCTNQLLWFEQYAQISMIRLNSRLLFNSLPIDFNRFLFFFFKIMMDYSPPCFIKKKFLKKKKGNRPSSLHISLRYELMRYNGTKSLYYIQRERLSFRRVVSATKYYFSGNKSFQNLFSISRGNL